jgi:hypothetical protein
MHEVRWHITIESKADFFVMGLQTEVQKPKKASPFQRYINKTYAYSPCTYIHCLVSVLVT